MFILTKDLPMKKFLSIVTLPALLMASTSTFAATSEGETSTISFYGTIKENTCVLDGDSLAKEIDLGTVESSVLAQPGRASLPTSFTISLKDCQAASASLTFSGDTANDETLSVTGGATGVGIQILEKGVPLKVDGSASSAIKAVGPTSTNDFTFAARYIALSDTIKTGNANATAQFTVKYQ